MHTYKQLILVFVILGLFVSVNSVENFRTISLVGTASVDTEPNVANIEFKIEATRESTSEALKSAADLSTSIISELKAFKRSDDSFLVKDHDIKSYGIFNKSHLSLGKQLQIYWIWKECTDWI